MSTKKVFNVGEREEINASDMVEYMMAAVEKAARRLSFAKEKGKGKSDLEFAVKVLQKAKSGGILTPSNKNELDKAYESLRAVDRDIRQTDEMLRSAIEFFYLYEDVKKADKILEKYPDLFDVKDLVKRGKDGGHFRIVGKEDKERMKKETRESGKTFPYLIVLDAEWFLPNFTGEYDEELAVMAGELAALAKERKNSLIDSMKSRATIPSLAEMLESDGKKGAACIYFPPLDIDDKKLPEGYLLLELIKDNSGAKLIILDAAGRFAQRYSAMKDKGRYLPLAYIKAGRITGYIESKDIFDDTRTFLSDILRALGRRMEIQKEKELSEESCEISEEEIDCSPEQSAAA